MGFSITVGSNGSVTVGGGSSGGGGIGTIIPTIISSFNDIINAGSTLVSGVGDTASGAIRTGGDIVRNTIDTTVTAIEDTANEIGRIDDNLLGGFADQGFGVVKSGFEKLLNDFGSSVFKGDKTEGAKDTSGFSTDILSGGKKSKFKKGSVSSGMGLQMSSDTGLQE